MKLTVSWLVLTLMGVLMNIREVQAVTYSPSMHEAQWLLELSPFECKMWQPIPIFGDAVFSYRAGESQKFYLNPKKQEMEKGKADLVSGAPLWNEDRNEAKIGKVAVNNTAKTVKLNKRLAFRLLNELYDGMSPEFTQSSWYEPAEDIQVGLSSIHFRKAYSEYRGCLTRLLPVNFDQIKRTRLHFETAKSELTPTARAILDNIILYIKTDTAVSGFYIDGHTDHVGRRLYNLDLSKRRAETVSQYLAARGVDEAMITTRYHGERYPVVSNSTSKNRAKNRRVTIRLERDGL